MAVRTPTDAYYKARRFSVAVSAALSFAVIIGLTSIPFEWGPIKIEDPKNITHILAVALVYSFWQFFAASATQEADVQNFSINRIDAFATYALSIGALLLYLYSFIPWDKLYSLAAPTLREWLDSLITGITAAAAAVASARILALARHLRVRIENSLRSRERALSQMLTSKKWLIFNNSKEEGLVGSISFHPRGVIQNPSPKEHSWRITDGRLEILDETGRVYSRFLYDEATDEFKHTNDPDTYSPRDQTIYRRPED